MFVNEKHTMIKRGILTVATTLVLAAFHIGAAEVRTLKLDSFLEFMNNDNDTVYVVNFWATWCAPCVKELPYFEEIGKKYAGENVKVVLVSFDFPNQIESRLIPFIRKNNLQSEILMIDESDQNKMITSISGEWSGALPATIVFRKSDRTFVEGVLTYEKLENIVQSKL